MARREEKERSMAAEENYKTVQKAKSSYKSRYVGALAPEPTIETKYEKPNFKNSRY